MRILREQPADYPAIADLLIAAFGGDGEARLVERIRQSDRYIPDLALVAEQEQAIVGQILFSSIDLLGEHGTLPVLGLAPLAVAPAHQRQGIGTALMHTGLEIADTLSESLIVVLGHPQFYTRFGFVPSVRYGITSPFPVPDEVFMVRAPQGYQTQYEGKIVYPPAFDGV